ncbi:hypothetical protein PF672P2_00051 [Parabacteroides phage PF672P2]|nr:hypothetical protein PF672P2_00051 [Parabacteroides phage PF672P2]
MCEEEKEKPIGCDLRYSSSRWKYVPVIDVKVPVNGLYILYNGEQWFTQASLAIHEGMTKRCIQDRCRRGCYESLRVYGVLLWRKKSEDNNELK